MEAELPSDCGRDVEIDIGSTTILIQADVETQALSALAAVCAANTSKLFMLLPLQVKRF